ncbi:hypothetical protein QYM36_018071 [Artemia franciscana]|uniref:Uncharacterized protein n=1 Tax=Artemia franciscana TaxID=6661 RepID=A0AA88HAJ7_ARTSF|nr:hypothetical protein QYM36_018071 [Artemia franciscana]
MKRAGTSREETITRLALEIAKERQVGTLVCDFVDNGSILVDRSQVNQEMDSERAGRNYEGQEQEHDGNHFSDQNSCSKCNTKRKRNRSKGRRKDNNKRKHSFIEDYCDTCCKKHCKEFDVELESKSVKVSEVKAMPPEANS